MEGELTSCVEDDWKTSDEGLTLQERICEEKVRQLTEALILCVKENLKMAQQLMVERQHFSLVVMETRKLHLEILDWRTVVDILVAEINVLFPRTSVKVDKKPVLAVKTPEKKNTPPSRERKDTVKSETMSIDDSSTVDDGRDGAETSFHDFLELRGLLTGPAISDAEPLKKNKEEKLKRKSVEVKSVPKDLHKRPRGRPRIHEKKEKPLVKKERCVSEASFDKSANGYQCKICKTMICAKQYLAKHLLRMHKEKEPTWYTCEFCGKSFKVRWKVAAHVKHMHLKIPRKRLMCDICGKSFTDKSSLNHHRKGHFEDRPYLCDICGKGYKTQRILTSHKKSHEQSQEPKEYSCKECDLVTTDEEAWAEHLKIHPNNSEPRKLKCKVCFQEFSHQVMLGKHMKTHPELPRFQCDQCEKDFGSESALKTHREGHSGEMKFSCDICNKKFAKRQAHFFHKKWHHKKCDQCGVMFPNRIALEEHSFVHTGIPPYECPACSMKFINRRLFWKHKLTHDELKPFVCPCGSRFVNSTHLAGHQKLHAKLGPIIVPRGNKSSTTFVRKKKSTAATGEGRPLGNFTVETVFGGEVIY